MQPGARSTLTVVALLVSGIAACTFDPRGTLIGGDGAVDRPGLPDGGDDRDAALAQDPSIDRPDAEPDLRADAGSDPLPVDLSTDGTSDVHPDVGTDAPVDMPLPGEVITVGLNGGDTTTAVLDIGLVEEEPDSPHALETQIAIGSKPNFNALIRFEMAPLIGRTVLEANLELFVDDESSESIVAHVVLQGWDLLATWEQASFGTAWTDSNEGCNEAGSCRVDPPVATSPLGPVNTTISLALPAPTVQSWIDSPVGNQGVLLRMASTEERRGGIVSSNGTDGRRPRLRIRLAP